MDWSLVNIYSTEDINNLYDECMKSDSYSIKFSVIYVYDPIEFIKSGFLPLVNDEYLDNLYDAILEYMNGMDIENIRFWFNSGYVNAIKNLHYNSDWVFHKMKYFEEDGLRYGGSIGLILYGKTYKSLRAITNMSMFRGPNSLSVKQPEIVNNKVRINNEMWNVIPVTRYASGMSRGLYFDEVASGEYCGTFYYSEPESKTLLAYKTERTYFNKTDAIKHLMPNYRDNLMRQIPLQQIIRIEQRQHIIDDHISGKLPPDLRMTPKEYEMYIDKNLSPYSESLPFPDQKYYVGVLLRLYAIEDLYDQLICKAAQQQNIDIIILTHMIGSHQVVTEVLDTRDRSDSFKSLISIED